jgi:hypothetical protein
MESMTRAEGLVKVNLRKAVGMVRRAERVWLDVTAPTLLSVAVTKGAARKLLADLRAKGLRRVSLLLVADDVGLVLDGTGAF